MEVRILELTIMEGEKLIKIARDAISEYIKEKKEIKPPVNLPKILNEKRGVFVTLYEGQNRELRGCIGYPYPTLSLAEATIKAAISSAFKDFRFHPPYGPGPVTLEELENLILEISVLTKPEIINIKDPMEYPNEINIGKDGLIVEHGLSSGLLLPQVPVEQGWNCEEYLSYCSRKAGLLPDTWLDKNTKIYKFQAQIFAEETPKGNIIIKDICSEK
jgi:uncharacterized protein (TIGR00296 family)